MQRHDEHECYCSCRHCCILEKENESLKNENVELKHTIGKKDERICELEQRNAKLEENVSEITAINEEQGGEKKQLKEENRYLKKENRHLKQELASLKVTVSAVVARSIDAEPNRKKNKGKRNHKPGRKKGHEGKSRRKPEYVDAKVELDQTACSECGSMELSAEPTDSYVRVVEDIVPSRVSDIYVTEAKT